MLSIKKTRSYFQLEVL